jgi:cell wall-associated NlpC family hydrolase
MTSRPRALAVVSLAALDVRRRPDHRAELTSQLLMGETVRLLRRSTDRRWWEVENRADGYRGWVRDWGLVEASPARVARWTRRARARVGQLFVELREEPGRGALVTPLFWNARMIPVASRGRFRRVELPDGRRGWLPAAALESGRARCDLAARVRALLGVPYLWGGRTPLGFDCSGFTQQVLAEQGLAIARDAGEQFRRARPLGRREAPRAGDLVFFGAPRGAIGHVGVGLGGGYYAHCRRHVRINSVDPANPLHDNELEPQMRGWRRPLRGA